MTRQTHFAKENPGQGSACSHSKARHPHQHAILSLCLNKQGIIKQKRLFLIKIKH
jgi:hypothetical protein